jgi:hypothetical protein
MPYISAGIKGQILIKQYGFLKSELVLLMNLNDRWLFTFEEFSKILQRAPKAYSSNLTKQRILDSLEWLDYIQTFREPDQEIYYVFSYDKWLPFIIRKKNVLHRILLNTSFPGILK